MTSIQSGSDALSLRSTPGASWAINLNSSRVRPRFPALRSAATTRYPTNESRFFARPSTTGGV